MQCASCTWQNPPACLTTNCIFAPPQHPTLRCRNTSRLVIIMADADAVCNTTRQSHRNYSGPGCLGAWRCIAEAHERELAAAIRGNLVDLLGIRSIAEVAQVKENKSQLCCGIWRGRVANPAGQLHTTHTHRAQKARWASHFNATGHMHGCKCHVLAARHKAAHPLCSRP